ncbi:MAG: regulatory protein RecX [Gemmatimonadaceae bacterium]|nr:regulatory protein RecX [Gemmatimonadaceae bacterium]
MAGIGRVTALREHPRRAGRYVVEVDGEAVGAVSVDRLADLGLRVGSAVDDALRARLEEAARAVACYDRATDGLARRARSRVELSRWLKQREFSAVEIEPTLDKLEALGLLNDREYAHGFARSRLAVGRGQGPRRVAAELARRGVARELVDEVLAELRDEGLADEATSIAAVAQRKWRTLAELEPQVARRRLIGFLSRRGFSTSAIAAELRRLGGQA